jgi:hypothetical protein
VTGYGSDGVGWLDVVLMVVTLVVLLPMFIRGRLCVRRHTIFKVIGKFNVS